MIVALGFFYPLLALYGFQKLITAFIRILLRLSAGKVCLLIIRVWIAPWWLLSWSHFSYPRIFLLLVSDSWEALRYPMKCCFFR